MENKQSISGIVFILLVICIFGSIAASLSVYEIIPRLNGWQAGGYAVVGGIFIALTAVIANEILAFFKSE